MNHSFVFLKHFVQACTLGLFSIGLFFSSQGLHAQIPTLREAEIASDTAQFDLTKDLAEQLLPFDSLYQAALRFSPTLKYQSAYVDGKLEAYRYTKVIVLEGIYPFVNYGQGNQSLTATGTTPTEGLQLSNGYRWGINVQIPLSQLLGRRARTHEAKADYRAALAMKDAAALTLKRELITIYQNLLTAQRVLKVRLRDEQVAMAAYRVAEVEVQQGKSEPLQLAQASSIYSITKSYAERERGDLLIHLYNLEALVGLPIQTLKIKSTR